VSLELDTVRGPAWKPLPVLVDAALAPLGPLAPAAWLVVARAGALAALPLAWVLAARLAPRRLAIPAGALAATSVALTDSMLWHAGVGNSEGLVVALALLALERHGSGRPGQAFAALAVAGLVRVEVWPFLAVYGVVVIARDRRRLWRVLAVGVALLVLWFVPDWAGSGTPGRSSERARVLEPGAPGLAARPLVASLGDAGSLLPVAVAPGLVVALLMGVPAPIGSRRRALIVPASAGLAWIGVVAAMAELGYSGEARYALPGAAILAVPAAAGLGWGVERVRRGSPRAARGALVATAVLVAVTVVAAAWRLPGELRRLDHEAAVYGSLDEAVASAGGRAWVLACGRPFTGPYAVPALAWTLDVPMRALGTTGEQRAPAVAFAAAPTARDPVSPGAADLALAGVVPVAAHGPWTVHAQCGTDVP